MKQITQQTYKGVHTCNFAEVLLFSCKELALYNFVIGSTLLLHIPKDWHKVSGLYQNLDNAY